MLNKIQRVKIRDSVDLFLYDNVYLTAYYMNTRKRKTFRVDENMLKLIECIDGKKSIGEICTCMSRVEIKEDDVMQTISKLIDFHIVSIVAEDFQILSREYFEKYHRQINYFCEFLGGEEDGLIAQKKIIDSCLLIYGCGSVGGDIAIQLAMAGVESFILYDYDRVEKTDASRHLFFNAGEIGHYKTEVLAHRLKMINPKIKAECINERMTPTTEITSLISKASFIVNTLDEPYIGYTSSKISRISIEQNKAHYIAGGFDAHLASTGELVIPFITPCVECYAGFFKETLKDWKPKKHPVQKRYDKIGGISPMTLFSSSFASIEIIKYITGMVNEEDCFKTRGELLFPSLTLSYLDVKRDPNCIICGGKK